MVKVEDYVDIDGSSDGESADQNVSTAGTSGLKPYFGSVLTKEEILPSSSSSHLKSYFTGMGFSPLLVDKVIDEKGEDDENLLLETLFAYSAHQKMSPEASDFLDDVPSSDNKDDVSPINFSSDTKKEIEELDGISNVDLEKKSCLAAMNFSENEVDLAINQLGESASLAELVDFIVSAQEDENKKLDGSNNSNHRKNEETATDTLFGTMDKTLSLLQMGFTEDEVSSAINNFGAEVSINELADSIFANRIACAVGKQEDISVDSINLSWEKGNVSGCVGRPKKEGLDNCYPSSDAWITKSSSSHATLFDYEEPKIVKKAKYVSAADNIASCSNHYMQQANEMNWETAYESKPVPYHELRSSAEGRSVKEEPEMPIPNLHGNVPGLVSKPPYFFYANVVDVPQDTWRKLSQFLYATEPEYVNSQFFSAFIRKEGYLHNLPTEGRCHALPRPPMTIEDTLPHTKRWWPSWDTRKQLSCITSETAGVSQLCERLGNMMKNSQGLLSKEQQIDILHHCKTLNLIWVGPNKLSPIEPDHLESILGYPRQHTEIWGMEPSGRLKALKYSFQTDTLAYHISALKGMYPNGLRVLSIFTGIGGAEISLHRLGIHLRCVVSVEASETNRKIFKRWWVNSGQFGQLKQIGGIEKLTVHTLDGFIKQFGGFDIVIGGNPGNFVTPCSSSRDSTMGLDLHLFYEFVRVFQRVKSLMGRNG